jgi:hypothetical protein
MSIKVQFKRNYADTIRPHTLQTEEVLKDIGVSTKRREKLINASVRSGKNTKKFSPIYLQKHDNNVSYGPEIQVGSKNKISEDNRVSETNGETLI